jgi:hypothetical protein
MRTPNENIIDWDDEKEIVELITELATLLEKGYKTVRIETYETGNGTCEDGSYEFEFTAGKLIADF